MIDNLGTPVDQLELVNIFPAPEGSANVYYGRIRSGKTYGATCDVIDDLKMGRVVYATWPIKVEDFDDRQSFVFILRNILLFKKRFYKIPLAKNFHFIDAEKGEVDGEPTFDPKRPAEYIAYLNSLNHCSLYIDEAWRVVDSYQPVREMTQEARSLILVTGHKFKTVNLITQRPTSIATWARGNANRFFKFKKIASWPWVRFARFEFQDMQGDNVDESQEPVSIKRYWASKKIFNAYNSYFYGLMDKIHSLNVEAFDLTMKEKFIAMYLFFMALVSHKKELSTELSTDETF